METVTVPAKDWHQLNETVAATNEAVGELLKLLKGKGINKTWVRQTEFMALKNKKRHQVEYICKEHPELRRTRRGEGVQINLKEYNRIYN